ncbi:MAG: EAL domain-containing protein [Nevskia sp.]|nr:EAL domain-containing protein [Nevskia sp.]
MGTGFWAAQLIALLALRLPAGQGIDPLLSVCALFSGVLGGALLLSVSSGPQPPLLQLLGIGFAAAAALCGVSLLDSPAAGLDPPAQFDTVSVLAAAGLTVLSCLLQLVLVFRLRPAESRLPAPVPVVAPLVAGLLQGGALLLGASAARIEPVSACAVAVCLPPDPLALGLAIAGGASMVLALAAVAARLDAERGTLTAQMLSLADAAIADVRREAAAKERAQDSLRDAEARHRVLLETVPDTIVLIDTDNVVRYANQSVWRMFGYRPEEIVGNKISMLQPERLRMAHRQAFQRYLEDDARRSEHSAIETMGLRGDGREFPIELSFVESNFNGRRVFAGFIRDTSARRERESKILRQGRIHALLSRINGEMLHTRSRHELLDRVCRIAIEQGQFRLAIVGLRDGQEIKPVALHGVDDFSIERNVVISLDPDGLGGDGPTAAALRAQTVRVCNDSAADIEPVAWRVAATRRGHRSVALFPLIVGGQLAGCLSLYASEPFFFGDDDVRLLNELARNVSYAMEFVARDEKLDYLAFYDPLTGLANRRLFGDRLNEFSQAARLAGQCMAVVLVDLEDFKSVNDTLGSGAGDSLLRAVATRLVRIGGNAQSVARLGADVFGLVLPQLKQASDFQAHWQAQIANSMSRSFKLHEQELRVSAKFGVALFPDDGDDADSLVRNAEAALKQAKHSGERLLFYSQEISKALNERLNLASQLRGALERKEFVLYYQPKVHAADGLISGAEALIRWNSPELGQVPPGRFVPLLEETGLVLEVGRWALIQAASDRKRWIEMGLATPRVAVNLSSVQLRSPDIVEVVRLVIDGIEESGGGLDLEITETILMTDVEQHIHKLKIVRDMGLSISIDDFGTGYSSLAYLAKLPINAVKIDRSFIVGMTESTDTMNIVSTIISLAHSMNLKVIAEGVESQEQLRFLKLLQCDQIQGYLFAKPLPPGDFEQLLRDGGRLALE